MYYIKSLPPNMPCKSWNFTRFGVVIPKKEITIESLKVLFKDSPLSEEKLLAAMRADDRIIIENENDREHNIEIVKEKKENSIEAKHEKKIIRINKTQVINKKIKNFNEEKELAMATTDKEDDKIVAIKEKALEAEIKKHNKDIKYAKE